MSKKSKLSLTSLIVVVAALTPVIASAEAQNTAPVCQPKTITINVAETNYVTSISVSPTELQACADSDGDPVTVISVKSPGALASDGRITIPYPGQDGQAVTVSYVVSDGKGGQGTSTITLKNP